MFRKVLILEYSHLQSKLCNIIFSNYPECELFFALKGLEVMHPMELQEDIDLIVTDINMQMM